MEYLDEKGNSMLEAKLEGIMMEENQISRTLLLTVVAT